MNVKFRAKIWKYDGQAGWYFVSLPKKMASEIRKKQGQSEEGWGRLKVLAKIKNYPWQTAIWFDTKAQTYLLPLKAQIRKQLELKESKIVEVVLSFESEENLFRSWQRR